jgi:hypothetical protein
MKIMIYSKNPIVVNDELMKRLRDLKKHKRLTKFMNLDDYGNLQALGDTVFIPSDFFDKHFSQEIKVI